MMEPSETREITAPQVDIITATDREARTRRATAQAAGRLRARVMTHAPEPTIEVDASALISEDDTRVRYWYLYTCPDDDALWNHPQSHADQYFPLAECLLGIASCYVDREAL